MIKKLFASIFILFCSSCSFSSLIVKSKGNLKLRQVDFIEVPGWQKDSQNRAIESFINSCSKFIKMPQNKQVGGKVGNIIAADFKDVCDIAIVIKGMGAKQARNFFENWFVPFKVFDDDNERGLFTGYYIPELRGSRVKTKIYQYPIYSRPKELTSKTYFTRKEIEEGALDNKNLELLYVDDQVDLFFMHIQGSGVVKLEDGSVVKLGYSGKNNYSYSSIGKYIIKNNIISDGNVSYFSIKKWLKNNPEEAREVMNINQSYVFFRVSNNDSAIGSQGVSLTPYRSIAVDTGILPMGFPMWLDVDTPRKSYQKLVVAQDTGSAIKGAVRADIFFGKGKKAENLAARMNYKGSYYILLPIAAVDRMVGR